ncbi:Gfo/Idh/MocA family oxidoreductase [Luteolibacter pohnpeiensis]|uniref:Gfo/Idh/MocA family oxidoreductase n=1 Tax=Luteolibacter pohnpeiensis TaxID=454153 RepID=A0A934S8N2_9BACT|nr:Gfo/Idh/MocA family oxidoreductase [Luteolibacter pohnpeiensis]MBK1882871.1 Gfo/Idh/MocA family oxidoreductase [Luteolibacter pohnpeiensis]
MNPATSRRNFLAAAGATAAVVGFPSVLRGQDATDHKTLKIGLVGAGGRGTGAASQALSADPNVKLWAIGDIFETQITRSLESLQPLAEKIDVPEGRRFVGMDAYQKVLDSGVDVILLTTPPAFRPQHLRAAVEAGKHVFTEKPMAVDIDGIKSVLESTRIAKQKGTTLQHGFCWRFSPNTREGYAKVLSGELGSVVSIYGTYMSSVPKPSTSIDQRDPKWADVEWQLRNWMGHEWLSGGPLLEQAIHTVDKVSWAMGDIAPIAARAGGGRAQRKDDGNVWDHYEVVYEYPGNVFCTVGQRQFPDTFNEVMDRVFCEKGTMEAPSRVLTKDRAGKITWAYRKEVENMYQVCHNEWFAAIRAGKELNSGEYMANSTMLAILGREAAHTGQRITWDELWKKDQDLAPDTLSMGDSHPVDPVPTPGTYKLG